MLKGPDFLDTSKMSCSNHARIACVFLYLFVLTDRNMPAEFTVIFLNTKNRRKLFRLQILVDMLYVYKNNKKPIHIFSFFV